jgi:Skp family chaperone for outer membrane proteins
MKSTVLLAAVLGLGLATSAAAQQEPSANMQIVAEKIRADKKLLVASNMDLTEAEAAKFWPVYDAYQADLGKLADRTLALIKEYAANYESMTDLTADKLLTEMLAIDKDRTSLLDKYRGKFAATVSARKVARYYQIENKIHAVVDYQLADQIPLVP